MKFGDGAIFFGGFYIGVSRLWDFSWMRLDGFWELNLGWLYMGWVRA